MTEQDVLNAYQLRLTNLVHKCSPRIPFDDACIAAQMELLLLLRGYRPAYHGTFWEGYARPGITDKLKELQKQQNTLRRIERVSLDAVVTDETDTTFGQLLLIEQPKINQVELRELLSYAPPTARQVGWCIINRYSQAEIQEDLRLSDEEYKHNLCALQKAWEEYNRDAV